MRRHERFWKWSLFRFIFRVSKCLSQSAQIRTTERPSDHRYRSLFSTCAHIKLFLKGRRRDQRAWEQKHDENGRAIAHRASAKILHSRRVVVKSYQVQKIPQGLLGNIFQTVFWQLLLKKSVPVVVFQRDTKTEGNNHPQNGCFVWCNCALQSRGVVVGVPTRVQKIQQSQGLTLLVPTLFKKKKCPLCRFRYKKKRGITLRPISLLISIIRERTRE